MKMQRALAVRPTLATQSLDRSGDNGSFRKPAVRSACLLLLWLVAGHLSAQCVITSTDVVTTAGGNISVEKDGPSIGLYPPPGGNCMLVGSNSAACNFVNAYYLKALATPGQQGNSPSCSWTCDCGPVSVGPSDGLPVELLDFSIGSDEEDEES